MPAKRLETKPVGWNPPFVWMLYRPLTGPKINRLAGSRVEPKSLIEIESVARARNLLAVRTTEG